MVEAKVGDLVDRRYLIRREIDRGGASNVFEAEQVFTTRITALKLMRPEYRGNAEAKARLLREAKVLTLARHPNVVTLLDAGVCETSGPYLAMELIEGRTLSGILAARRRLDPVDAILIAVQLCDALSLAHADGVVHRDVKPSNVFVVRSEFGTEAVKLIDFGIAALSGELAPPPEQKLTHQGSPLGTPEYMASEQLLGKSDVDHRADQFAIAATLYECLVGRTPFEGTYGEILLASQTSEPPSLQQQCSELAPEVVPVIERALSPDPEKRYATVLDFASALLDAAHPTRGFTTLLGVRRAAPPPLPTRARQVSISTPASPADAAPAVPEPARRQFDRAPYVTPARLTRSDASTIDGRTEDISEGGLLVISDRPCESNEQVEVRFALPISGRITTVAATTRWFRTARGVGALGVQFLNLSVDAQSEIARYVGAMGTSAT